MKESASGYCLDDDNTVAGRNYNGEYWYSNLHSSNKGYYMKINLSDGVWYNLAQYRYYGLSQRNPNNVFYL